MRVLQLGLSCFKGGVESCILNFSKELSKEGIIFDYVDIYGDGIAIEKEIIELGGRIYTLSNYKKDLAVSREKFKEILSSGEYSCVHMNMLSAALSVFVLDCVKLGIYPIIHSHNASARGIVRKILHILNRKRISNISPFKLACSTLSGEWMFHSKDFRVLSNGIDIGKYRFNYKSRLECRKALGIDEEAFVLGFVGRLEIQKNPCYLIDILSAVKQQKKVKLLIVGDGSLKDKMIQKAKDKGVLEDIYFAGAIDDTSKWYSAFDVFLLPSSAEGFGIVALEAQAAGLPTFISQAVPDDIMLSDLVQKCELTQGAENWSEKICNFNFEKIDREKYSKQLENSSYSITVASKKLKEIYEEVEKFHEQSAKS